MEVLQVKLFIRSLELSNLFIIYSSLMFGVVLVYVHMNYTRNWMTSLVCFILMYIEIIIMTLYYYGERFAAEPLKTSIIEYVYYFTVFALYALSSIFSVMTFEIVERRDFYRQ